MSKSCHRVRELASAHLDNELPGRLREQVDEHLRSCEPCVNYYSAQREFGDRVADAVSAHRPPRVQPGLDDRVLAALTRRRESTLDVLDASGRRDDRGAPWRWAAAGVLFAVVWFSGYALGQGWIGGAQRGGRLTSVSPTGPTAAVSELDLASFRAAGVRPQRFCRAVRGLLTDVPVLAAVPSDQQRALLAAQVKHFDLADQANLVLAVAATAPTDDRAVRGIVHLARFAKQVAQAVHDGEPLNPENLLDGASHRVLVRATYSCDEPRREPPPIDRAGLLRVVEVVGDDLDDGARSGLVELLVVRDEFVRGKLHVTAGPRTDPADNDGEHPPFFMFSRITTALASAESGDAETAEELVDEVSREVRGHASTIKIKIKGAPGAVWTEAWNADEMPPGVERFMRRLLPNELRGELRKR